MLYTTTSWGHPSATESALPVHFQRHHREQVRIRQDTRFWFEQAIKFNRGEGNVARFIYTYTLNGLELSGNQTANMNVVTDSIDKAALTLLTSPIDGIVAQLSVHTLGAVVKPGDPCSSCHEAKMVEAMVLNKDIGFVREGQPAEVKLEAFPFTRYGVINGTVESISRDSVENEQLGLVFPCLVRLAQTHINVGENPLLLEPGFVATAEIKTGHRRIIEFLLSPLSRRLQEAGRER